MPDIGQHEPSPHDRPDGDGQGEGGTGDEGHDSPDPVQAADADGAPVAITVDPKIANGWLHTAKFLTTAPTLQYLPRSALPEIAFVGRSNVGKSSCINTLTQQHRLAFASKTPGRTQAINLFTLGKQGIHDAVLADLPGYGYAKVPLADKHRWQKVMANYLVSRDNLAAVVLLCDPRHGLTELDDLLLDILRPRVEEGLKLLVILTKSDKLNRTESAKALSIMRLQVAGAEVRMFSSSKKTGVDEVAQLLWHWAHPLVVPNASGEGDIDGADGRGMGADPNT
jgi:GTP-binding protein